MSQQQLSGKGVGARNGKIEFLRFVFAICILLFHISKRFFGTNGMHWGNIYFFAHGCFGVEFFFLVSGYLLGKKAYGMREESTEGLGRETFLVVRKKVLTVFPMAFFATALTILVNLFALFDKWPDRLDYLIHSWPSLLLLNLFGFETSWANKLTWYLSAYLMCSAILYPLGRRFYGMFTYILSPMGALFLLGWMDHTWGYLLGSDIWTGFCYLSFLRGLAEMSLGIFAFHLTRHLDKLTLSNGKRRFLAVLEPLGYLFVLYFMNLKLEPHNEFPMLFILMGVMILSFSHVNPMEKVFSHPVFAWLGRISLPLYLNQFYVIRFVMTIMKGYHGYVLKGIIIVVACILCAIVCDYIFMKKPATQKG